MDRINRATYFDRMSDFVGNSNAKVFIGIRRCGKSTMMRCFSETIGAGRDINEIYIDMELWDNRELRDPETLYKRIKSNLAVDKMNVLFLDEIQDVTEWESVVRSLINEGACDIYITGSNSRLLSSEYTTYLSGRLNVLEMFPLSFRECVEFNSVYGNPATDEELLQRFIKVGGFPMVWRSNYGESSSYSTVRDILSSIRAKDIVEKFNIRNPDLLDRIFRFVCDNLGKYTSMNNIYNVLQAEDRSVSRDTVYAYMGHLEAAFLVQKANVYDVKGKRVLSSKCKYFLTDIGLKHAVFGYRGDDISGHMENILYLDLRSRGYTVWVGDNNGKEIDLVAEKYGKKVYVQSAFRLSSEEVIKREFGNLKGIKDSYPKYVVTMDDDLFHGDADGITSCRLIDFLKKEEL